MGTDKTNEKKGEKGGKILLTRAARERETAFHRGAGDGQQWSQGGDTNR